RAGRRGTADLLGASQRGLRGLARPAHRIQAVHQAPAGAAHPDHGARAQASRAGGHGTDSRTSRTLSGSVAFLVPNMKTAGGETRRPLRLMPGVVTSEPLPPYLRRS